MLQAEMDRSVDSLISELEADLVSLDGLRLAYINARREAVAKMPKRPGALEWPIKLGEKLLWPTRPIYANDDDYWTVESLRELALGLVKYEGYRLGKTGAEAKQVFEVPQETRREAEEVLAVAIDHQARCRQIMGDAAAAGDDLRNMRLRVVARLHALWGYDTDDLDELTRIGGVAEAARDHREMQVFFNV